MARPRTHGRPISFRLPLDAHEQLEHRAAEHGESVPEYVRRNILRALQNQNRKPSPAEQVNGYGLREVTPIPKTGKKKAATG